MKIWKYILVVLLLGGSCVCLGQVQKVQHRPYTDLRFFHYGIHVGMHFQDIDFTNVGPITTTAEDGTETTSYVSCDMSSMNPGFNVGVVGEFRISEHFQFRIAPAIYFGARHLTFKNHYVTDDEEGEHTETQDLKTTYITTSFELIFAAPRCNNHRVYMFAGVCPAFNLTRKSSDILCLNRFRPYLELGFGLDQYLPYFKVRPELKFMFGLGNALDTSHADEIQDRNLLSYTNSVNKACTRMITLSFYFE